MANRPNKAPGSKSLPSKEAILDFIKSQSSESSRPAKIGKREIAKAFDIKGNSRIALKAILKKLEIENAVERRGKKLHRPGALPPLLLANITRIDRSGDLVAAPAEWIATSDGHIPNIHVRSPNKKNFKGPTARIGDVVLIRLDPSSESSTTEPSGRIVKIVSKHQSKVIGVFRRQDREPNGVILPVDKKALGRQIVVRSGDEGAATNNDLVVATLTKGTKLGVYFGKITETVGSLNSEKSISLIAIHTHGIPDQFSRTAIAEAEVAMPATLTSGQGISREDWRSTPFITIDPEDAKDHDDAIHASPDPEPDNHGGYVVSVAIADVSAYVSQGSAIDKEALERGNSVYFPDRVVPMLPERISNDLCSLKPNEDRPAIAVRLVIGPDGRKKSHSFHRILMRSMAKLSYNSAQSMVDGSSEASSSELTKKALKPLWQAWTLQLSERQERAPLDLNLPERKLKLRPDGSLDYVYLPPRLEAHRLVEDFMIMANVAAAETLEHHHTPLIYRVHDEPSLEKLRGFKEVLASIGFKMTLQGALRPVFFNNILEKIEGSPHQAFVNDVVLRSQAQAEYSNDNYGHFGLNLRRYAHFTSPIRRYSDLVVHRALIRALKLGADGLKDESIPSLAELAASLSAAERRAMVAERETIDRLIVNHLSSKIGASFSGRISGVTRSGLFVKLEETGADGFVPAATIGKDFYKFDEAKHALIGQRTAEIFRLGDQVKVKLVEASPVAGALRFELLPGLREQHRSSLPEGISNRPQKKWKNRR